MGHREGLDIELANGKRTVTIDDSKIEAGFSFATSSSGAMRQPDRHSVFPRQAENTAEVIAVFVGNENTGNLLGRTPLFLQPGHAFAQAEAAIDHQAGRPSLDKQRISCAATTERGKADHCNC